MTAPQGLLTLQTNTHCLFNSANRSPISCWSIEYFDYLIVCWFCIQRNPEVFESHFSAASQRQEKTRLHNYICSWKIHLYTPTSFLYYTCVTNVYRPYVLLAQRSWSCAAWGLKCWVFNTDLFYFFTCNFFRCVKSVIPVWQHDFVQKM